MSEPNEIASGWRLLDADEKQERFNVDVEIEMWTAGKWDAGGVPGNSWSGNCPNRIYRTRLSRADLRKARGLEPEPKQTAQAPADYQLPPPPTEYTDVAGFARLRVEYRKLEEIIASLRNDLKTAQLNASAAVKLAQDREKEVTDFRMLLNEVREERDASLNRITELESERENLIIGREWQRMVKELAEARHRIGELEKELESHAFDLSPAMVQARNDQLNEENETLREGTREWVNLADAAKAERDALKAELANLKSEFEAWQVGPLASAHRELDARKRERDEARECARKESDLRHAQVEKLESEARRYRKVIDEQKQQLTEKSALCERLKEVLEAVQSMFDSGPRWVSADHVDVLGEVRFALQRAEGQP